MKMKEHAAEAGDAIKAALETYRLDKLALQDAEQTATWARENGAARSVMKQHRHSRNCGHRSRSSSAT